MPYKSMAQEKFFNANRPKMEAQGVNVDEWNSASKGMKLPKKSPMAKLKSETHTYDSNRPKRPVVSRYQ